MNKVGAILSLAALASAQQLTPMCRPYAFMKVMEGCIGKDAVDEHKMRMMTTVRDTCLSMPTDWDMDMRGGPGMKPGMKPGMMPGMKPGMMGDMPGMMENMTGMMGDMMPDMMGEKPGMMGDMPDMMGEKPGMMGDMPDMMGDMMGEMMGGMMGMMGDMMSKMGDMMGSIAGPDMIPIKSNISCIMKEMQWCDEFDNPNVYYLKDMIGNLSLNPILTMNMNKEIDMCFQKSMCEFEMKSPFGPKITKILNFAKCVGYGMFKSCAMSEVVMKLPMGPVDPETMMAAMLGSGQEKGMEEMEKESAFMNILMTMFGPMSPFMQ